jgi:PRC-barrel domain
MAGEADTNAKEPVMEKFDETTSLISASKVTGTEVYNTAGEHLGDVYDVMLDKRSGKIAYAVMSFGGFLGIGERYHPLPWATLEYDTKQGGYVVGLTKQLSTLRMRWRW